MQHYQLKINPEEEEPSDIQSYQGWVSVVGNRVACNQNLTEA